MTDGAYVRFDDECFVISPIGHAGSGTRDRADVVRDQIITPAATRLGLTVLRADQIADPGNITDQVIEHVVGARLVVADLTDRNPNVFYELAVRHSFGLPVVLIADAGEELPFDLISERVQFLDLASGTEALRKYATTVDGLERSMRASLAASRRSPVTRIVESPVTDHQGEPVQLAIGRLEDQLQVIQDLADPTRLLTELGSMSTDLRRFVAQWSARQDAESDYAALESRQRTLDLALEPGIRRAIADLDFDPYAQPIVDLHSGGWRGIEISLRLSVPEDLPAPASVVPTAERLGLLPELGAALLNTLNHRTELPALLSEMLPVRRDPSGALDRDFFVSVNASTTELVDGGYREALNQLKTALAAEGIDLQLEITETALFSEGIGDVLTGLHDQGVRVVIDDFGTGYSNLGHLRELPISGLKVDRRFVAELSTSALDATIVRAIIGLAGTLGLGVTAEGVETDEQVRALLNLGCDMAQGYLFGRPQPMARVADEFSRHHGVGDG